ncbi:hypothetical protein PUN28_019089 [Cardiocondyla obscurior]|uniref:Uncharacterized protein n=1 Tax=Cardiocondyla obscurior TaxID=286306 RepID=A0AAW2EH54_9HYME
MLDEPPSCPFPFFGPPPRFAALGLPLDITRKIRTTVALHAPELRGSRWEGSRGRKGEVRGYSDKAEGSAGCVELKDTWILQVC